MKWFRRKPRKFDYAAVRIGNVYVLPPDEDDVREFNRKRRRELTRRGFVVAGAAAALGAIAWLLWPGDRRGLDANRLLEINPATADRAELIELCTRFFQHPDPAIRTRCAVFMGLLREDLVVKTALWEMIRDDPQRDVRKLALQALVRHHDKGDIGDIVQYYADEPLARPIIDKTVDDIGFQELRLAIQKRMRR